MMESNSYGNANISQIMYLTSSLLNDEYKLMLNPFQLLLAEVPIPNVKRKRIRMDTMTIMHLMRYS